MDSAGVKVIILMVFIACFIIFFLRLRYKIRVRRTAKFYNKVEEEQKKLKNK